ncbi:MAG: redox-sensing transcriptional repressor Rex [Verrucomicrobia bacterium]|nr:redox-sensing transcriptional repressor Rex [Verrucomicrobiota bacterium]
MEKGAIPKKVIYRLSTYHRCLQRLADNSIITVSSGTLAKAAGVNSSQLRKDIAYLGQWGTRGLGYPVDTLAAALRDALRQEKLQPVILIGAGNLGSALLRYQGFQKEGFEVIAAFDSDPAAARARGVNVPLFLEEEMENFLLENNVRLAILCVPAEYAQGIVNRLVRAGIQGILNFSPAVLEVPKEIVVNNVDLASELENLSYFIR